MDVARKRRWFRFSLRTMFVAFTVAAAWLAYSVHVVEQRKAFIAALPAPFIATARSDSPFVLRSKQAERDELYATYIFIDRRRPFRAPATTGIPMIPYETVKPTVKQLPWLRRMIGDQDYSCIAYFAGPSLERARALFPEAVVMVAEKPWPWPDVSVTKSSRGWDFSK